MTASAWCRVHADGVCLEIKVVPRASWDEIGEVVGDRLKVRVTAPPVDFAANEAVLELLAKVFEIPRSRVVLSRGRSSRNKTVFLAGVDAAGVAGVIHAA